MAYTVKEIFYTLQGEGANAGRAAVFLRFTGCNLWTGLEKDRENAVCKFCDTDFVGVGPDGGKFQTQEELSTAVNAKWPKQNQGKKLVVCTGGEPLLQLDEKLINALKKYGFEVAVETNGTIEAPEGIDWLCVSPKSGSELKQMTADELKLVYPQKGAEPEIYESYLTNNFLLQPMDGKDYKFNTQSAIEYCMSNHKWKLSVQTHKILGIR
jgi:7-carboxy-7-deazaguanine synthase (Cx14CxxC type)